MGGKAKRDYHAEACKRGRANISARSGHGEPDKIPDLPAAVPRTRRVLSSKNNCIYNTDVCTVLRIYIYYECVWRGAY